LRCLDRPLLGDGIHQDGTGARGSRALLVVCALRFTDCCDGRLRSFRAAGSGEPVTLPLGGTAGSTTLSAVL
jgi:hypothetical protein